MATFGTNVASTSKGAFAIFSVAANAGEKVVLFDANIVTGEVVAVAGKLPLTSLQTAALSTVFKSLLSLGTVGGNELEFLQKLVGVLPLTAGDSVTLDASLKAGDVWHFGFVPLNAGTVLVYVPNSAAAGPYTGSGATESGGSPSGAAGGVLGYPGSNYPDPNGLAPNGFDQIPVKPGVGDVNLVVDQAATGDPGCSLTIDAAKGANAVLASSDAGTFGGALVLRAGAGGNSAEILTPNPGAGSQPGGDGGFVELFAGDGADGTTADVPQDGGSVSIHGGDGGAVAAQGGVPPVGGKSGGKGGNLNLRGGFGNINGGDVDIRGGNATNFVADSDQVTGGDGGGVNLVPGSGGDGGKTCVGGNGGDLVVGGGPGGLGYDDPVGGIVQPGGHGNDTTLYTGNGGNPGGRGGTFFIEAGEGGTGSDTGLKVAPGAGGTVEITAGQGGHGTTTQRGGAGGDSRLDAGAGGTTGGFGAGAGGTVRVGNAHADFVLVGRPGDTTASPPLYRTTSVASILRAQATGQTVVAGDVVKPKSSTVFLSAAAPLSLDPVTPVDGFGSGVAAVFEGGDLLVLVNVSVNAITVPNGGNVKLDGGAPCVLDQYGSLTLMWLGRDPVGNIDVWTEISRVTTPS